MAALWRASLAVPDLSAAEAAMAAFDGILDSVSVFVGDGGGWQVEGLSASRPGRAEIEARLALAAAAQHGSAPALVIERLPARDWLAENQAAFPPIAVGRYFIHGRYCESPRPAGRIGLLIDAATAFGTGEHATTRGCLLALDRLARCRGRRRRILDMGTGTGILAIAAAKTWRCPVEARDIDAEAVRVARCNARRNGVAAFVKARRSVGYRDRALHRAPFDLIFANILARPLIVMARDLRSALGDGGIAVLSGLLARQERAVLAAHRMLRLYLLRRIVLDGWSTLVLARGRHGDPSSAELPISERP